jgi:lipopolysaccharide/colanic/teichoic acid biosynthesis glycosyltransferase
MRFSLKGRKKMDVITGDQVGSRSVYVSGMGVAKSASPRIRRSRVLSSVGSPSSVATPAPLGFLKRGCDLIGAVLLLLLLVPIMGLTAVLVKASSPGPIIFKQRRLTLGGREFWLYKFRTMRCDAEVGRGAQFAQRGDARVTSVGRFLRRTRLDELPQLINVVRGEMSLIGPRPERPEMAYELAKVIPSFGRRLDAKAGLTGLAQVVQGYPDDIEGYRAKVALDRLYIRKQSLWLDLWIAARTVAVVLTGAGAR